MLSSMYSNADHTMRGFVSGTSEHERLLLTQGRARAESHLLVPNQRQEGSLTSKSRGQGGDPLVHSLDQVSYTSQL